MRCLDLFCGAGGAAMGYHRAGFEVVGWDIEHHPDYPFEHHVGDALDVLADVDYVRSFDLVHASPPCQAYTNAAKIMRRSHPDLVGPVREHLMAADVPYVIENVPGAPLVNPVTLCGAMFPGLRTYRHRLFESSIPIVAPGHPQHTAPITKMGRPPQEGEFMHVVGNFSGVNAAREAMGISWMTRDDLREAIPPAYTEHIGRQVAEHLEPRPVRGSSTREEDAS